MSALCDTFSTDFSLLVPVHIENPKAMTIPRITSAPIFPTNVTPGFATPQLGQFFAEVSTLCLQDLQGVNAIYTAPIYIHEKAGYRGRHTAST
jgi:hypothetical protein